MKDKKLFVIVIAVMVITIGLSIYMVYKQIEPNKKMDDNSPKEEVNTDSGLSLTEIMDKIDGYWHGSDTNAFTVTGFLKDTMVYTHFFYASEGGEGGDIKSLEHLEGDSYNLIVMLKPRLMCSEEFCEEGATIGQMSEPEEITIKLDLSNLDNQIINVNGNELTYLAHTFDEIEKKIYN